MKSIEIRVPRNLVDRVYPHPELYGDFIVSLKNGMITDVFYDENGCYLTITNDEDLIEYINTQEHVLPVYFFRNGVFSYRYIMDNDKTLLEKWNQNKTITISLEIDTINCLALNIDKLPSEFIFMFYWMEVGVVKKIIKSNTILLTLDVYVDDFVRGIDKKVALEILKWMLEDKNSLE